MDPHEKYKFYQYVQSITSKRALDTMYGLVASEQIGQADLRCEHPFCATPESPGFGPSMYDRIDIMPPDVNTEPVLGQRLRIAHRRCVRPKAGGKPVTDSKGRGTSEWMKDYWAKPGAKEAHAKKLKDAHVRRRKIAEEGRRNYDPYAPPTRTHKKPIPDTP